MPNVEHAAGTHRSTSDFPPSWGTPPGDPYGPERQAWILRNIHNSPVRSRARSRGACEALAAANALAAGPSRDAFAALRLANSKARDPHAALVTAQLLALRPPGTSRAPSTPWSSGADLAKVAAR